MAVFGQIVVGPPGSGKTTYCAGMYDFFKAIGRDAVIFNMDPANESVPYEAAADLAELVCASTVAADLSLGPNGSLLYAMEFLEKNLSWLEEKLEKHKEKYILFDFPGQVELYTHNSCIRNIVQRLVRKGHRLTAVNLVDSHYCAEPSKFIAVMLTSLVTMIQLELPSVNVLSKIDLVEQYGKLTKDLEFFTDNLDLKHMLDGLSADPHLKKFARLNEALTEVVEDFPFVGYHVLNIQDKETVIRLLRVVDKSNGYMYANLDTSKITYEALVGQPEKDIKWAGEIQERYVKR